MVEYLGADPGEAMDELDKIRGAHVIFVYLKKVYKNALMSAQQTESDDEQGWILQHFTHISGWASVPNYTEDMSHATAFIRLKGNQATEPYRIYLNCLVAGDMDFNNYVDHRETRPFDEIMLYSEWLACRLRLIAPHLPERVIRQFSYTQTISRHRVVFAPPALIHIQIEDMFDDYERHMLP
ncbi:uncharacterized protein LOC127136367 [Lathyrus oleraceus]|uniref:uncharacterized protein LOC127136367 n=1 Tax=Pisum sativum TaxID=3888 RepID=UPI0021D10745|nr:uncharacterized protein LOC127136367 [Pisum sativum]